MVFILILMFECWWKRCESNISEVLCIKTWKHTVSVEMNILSDAENVDVVFMCLAEFITKWSRV